MERRDPYRILQVQPDADPDVIKAAYRVLARKVHPDASAPLDEWAERRMTDLNWAYALVRDPAKRQKWESDRRRAPPPTPAEDATHGAPRGTSSTASQAALGSTSVATRAGPCARWQERDPDYLDWLRRHPSRRPLSRGHRRPAASGPQALSSVAASAAAVSPRSDFTTSRFLLFTAARGLSDRPLYLFFFVATLARREGPRPSGRMYRPQTGYRLPCSTNHLSGAISAPLDPAHALPRASPTGGIHRSCTSSVPHGSR